MWPPKRAQPKQVQLAFRVTPQQAAILKATAEQAGVSLSEWIRSLALRHALEIAGQGDR